MSLSLNEVEALARKAARGAGYSWGLSEEAAQATRRLCAWGFDGCGHLAKLLSASDGTDLSGWAPVPGAIWSARGGTLCPIAAGAALSDRAEALRAGGVTLESVARPLILVPFAGLAARALGTAVTLAWEEATLTTDGAALVVTGAVDAPQATVTATVSVTGRTGSLRPAPASTRADPDAAALEQLAALAHRTYAPATEESRLKGAGAGPSDND